MIGKTAYETRYCAYVDILGFTGLIDEFRSGKLPFEDLRSLLEIIHKPESVHTKAWYTEFRAQSISDAVAISTLANRAGLIEMLRSIEIMTTKLLSQGYFVRGALVKGLLYHDEKMVFGEALIRAYRLESEVVKYPRVMVTREIALDIEEYKKESGAETFDNWLEQADDGPMYVHTLRTYAALIYQTQLGNINKRPEDKVSLEHFQKIQDLIQQKFDESIDNPRHFEKIQWFANYWNRSIPFGTQSGRSIQGPGLNVATWLKGNGPST